MNDPNKTGRHDNKRRGRASKWTSTRGWTIAGVVLATAIGLAQFGYQLVKDPECAGNPDCTAQAGEDDFIENLRAQSTKDPGDKGPYEFVVVNTGAEGLHARTTNDETGQNEGFAQNHTRVFAECVTSSSFTPQGKKTESGPVWLKVKWPWPTGQPDPSGQAHQSSPTDHDYAWMYRGYLESRGHNGKIPSC